MLLGAMQLILLERAIAHLHLGRYPREPSLLHVRRLAWCALHSLTLTRQVRQQAFAAGSVALKARQLQQNAALRYPTRDCSQPTAISNCISMALRRACSRLAQQGSSAPVDVCRGLHANAWQHSRDVAALQTATAPSAAWPMTAAAVASPTSSLPRELLEQAIDRGHAGASECLRSIGVWLAVPKKKVGSTLIVLPLLASTFGVFAIFPQCRPGTA